MKKTLSIILAVWMLLCVFPFAGSAEDNTLTVTFYNDLRGSAAGSYAATVAASGKYALCWGDADGALLKTKVGDKELSYTPLYEFETKKEGKASFEPQSFTAIPYGAAKVLLTRAGEIVASFEVPQEKRLEKAQNYAYGVISDLHFEAQDDGSDQGIAPVKNAFDFFASVGAKNVFGSGDIATNADEKSYTNFANVVKNSSVLFLTCGGNHEVVSGYDRMYAEGGIFYKYMNAGVYDGSLEGVLDVAPDKHDFVYGIPGTNDIFIVICQARWDSKLESMKPLVEPETIDWFEQMLEKYDGKKIHLLMHTFLSDDDYDHVDGEGDISNKVGYGYAYYWNIYSEEDARLRRIIDAHDDLIWFNGHSHWIIEMQKYNPNLNIYDYEGTTATLVHVPSVTAPRTVGDSETSYHSNIGVRSEGLLMFSCDGYEIENAINMKTGEIYAYGCYIIYDRDEKTLTGAAGESASYVYDRQLSTLRFVGQGVADLSKIPAALPTAVRSVYVSRGITEITGQTPDAVKASLRRIEIKDGIKKIGQNAFDGCASVRELILPEELDTIGRDAFKDLGSGTPTGKATVTYGGTPEEYAAIRVEAGNDALKDATSLKRTVRWKIGEYVRSEILPVGAVPEYGGAAVSPCETEGKYLTFVGWNNGKRTFSATADLPKVSENVTYTATFGKEDDRYVEGKVNDKISWTFDRANGTLTVYGSGASPDMKKGERPWEEYLEEIYTIVVKTGIKTLGKAMFTNSPALRTLIIEDGVKTLGGDCFAYCDELTTLYLPASAAGVSQGACYQCNNLKNIYYGGTPDQWYVFSQRIKTSYNEVLRDASDPHCGVSAPTAAEWTVTFLDDEGQTVGTVEGVKYGEGVVPPSAPEKANKVFLGWDEPYFLVTGDMTVRAIYEKTAPSPEETLAALPYEPCALIVALTLNAEALAS